MHFRNELWKCKVLCKHSCVATYYTLLNLDRGTHSMVWSSMWRCHFTPTCHPSFPPLHHAFLILATRLIFRTPFPHPIFFFGGFHIWHAKDFGNFDPYLLHCPQNSHCNCLSTNLVYILTSPPILSGCPIRKTSFPFPLQINTQIRRHGLTDSPDPSQTPRTPSLAWPDSLTGSQKSLSFSRASKMQIIWDVLIIWWKI